MTIKANYFIAKKGIFYCTAVVIFLALCLIFSHGKEAYADDYAIYSDGIYRYRIIDEGKKSVQLIGIETTEKMKELDIPGKAVINGKEYTVGLVDILWDYYTNVNYDGFYNSVRKINVDDNFTGVLQNLSYAFKNLDTVEFYGKVAPKEVSVYLFNRDIKDFLFIVPEGTESVYSKVIKLYIHYYVVSDLYEQDIELTPTIVSADEKNIEYGCFAVDGFIYKVTKSAKNGIGKVELVGITHALKKDYIKLPEKVSNNGYTYKLTGLRRFSLVGCGARVIAVPDSVTDMEGAVFDSRVEILFLSKKCKVIPAYIITDENNETNLKYVYVPEGVTAISDHAFDNLPNNKVSIILPNSVKQVGKRALYAFKLVTFLNKKPLDKVALAINKGTTVKVNKSEVSAFGKILGSRVSVIAAKDIVKTKDLTVNKEELKLTTDKNATITAKLTKGSNETVYWLSANPDIVEVSDKGVVTPKKAGTTYVIAYTRTSGRHKAVKVTVSETKFNDGIFTYRITDPSKKTVTLCQARPGITLDTLTIPETVTYKKVKYTVTAVIADPDNPELPLIPEKYGNNKIKKITFPKSVTGKVGYLGILKSVESITFKGKTAPEAICNWYNDGGILAWQAVIYVPKGSVNAYGSSLWTIYGNNSTYQEVNYGCPMDFNIVEAGNDQVMRFVADGILYRVTKYAGKKKNGEAVVIGANVNLKKIVINSTVSYKGYTYKVTGVYKRVINNNNLKEIFIDDSIKKRDL